MAIPPELERRARRIALENAISHGGLARPEPVVARLLATDPALRARSREVAAAVGAIVEELRGLSADAQQAALAALGGAEAASPRESRAPGELPPLPGAADGAVVLRLAPFPSGALHIGNARMLFVNDYYRTLHRGRLLLVFDDTVGSEDKRIAPELFGVIEHDLELAGIHPDAVYYKSDRLPLFYAWARRVIDRGGAYVCTCPAALLRENRAAGRACEHRSADVGTTVAAWEGMLAGEYGVGEAVLRLRSALDDPDPAFRDRVLFRLSDLDHPRVGRRYRVWPMLEFSWAVDDVELGITHVLRGKDLVVEDRMESTIWQMLGVAGPRFLHWGLLRIREAKISKSKSYQEVRSGLYDGWADPRTWSIDSLDRRGITREALRRFTLSFGLSLADIEVPAETLYAENRAVIDATTPRRAFVADPVRVRVLGYPDELGEVELANHPDRPELGRRRVAAGPEFFLARADLRDRAGAEIRLKDLANLRLPREIPAEGAGVVEAAYVDRENRKLPRLQWVGAPGAVEVDLLQLDGRHVPGRGERALSEAKPGEHLQFERVGFVRVEADWNPGTLPVRVCYGHP